MMPGTETEPKHMDLAESLVSYARKEGADEVEVAIVGSTEFNVDIRHGEIENLIEAGSRSLGLRIIKGQRTAYASSSDLSKDSLHRLISRAVKRADLSSPDSCAGLPAAQRFGHNIAALNLFDPQVAELSPESKIELAKKTEHIALQDKRIVNSHGSTCETRIIKTTLANSNGFSQSYNETYCGLSLGLQAGQTDEIVEDYWSSSKRHFDELETPEDIAARCIARTVRHLHPRKIPTQQVPVVFESTMTSWLLGFLFACVSGVSVYQKTSFLQDKLGEHIADNRLTIYDDGLIPGLLGTTPFDSEGVPAQKTAVVDQGILTNFLCNTYAAKKLKLRSTGNAEGTGVAPHNFYLEAGSTQPDQIISSLDKGLILIRTLGHGLNPVTGDFSRGAYGLWVEKGEIAYPVAEITISGNLGSVLRNIDMIGNDLEFRTPICGPTLKIHDLMIAGT